MILISFYLAMNCSNGFELKRIFLWKAPPYQHKNHRSKLNWDGNEMPFVFFIAEIHFSIFYILKLLRMLHSNASWCLEMYISLLNIQKGTNIFLTADVL